MAGRCYEHGWGVPAERERRRAVVQADPRRPAHDWGEYNYAHMLFDGRGGEAMDRALAFALYRRAAERGHARAMNLVGRCLEAGWGVGPDRAAAETWYARSAEAGYYRAQFNHAVALLERCAFDEARAWLGLASQADDPAIRERIDAIRRDLARRGL